MTAHAHLQAQKSGTTETRFKGTTFGGGLLFELYEREVNTSSDKNKIQVIYAFLLIARLCYLYTQSYNTINATMRVTISPNQGKPSGVDSLSPTLIKSGGTPVSVPRQN